MLSIYELYSFVLSIFFLYFCDAYLTDLLSNTQYM